MLVTENGRVGDEVEEACYALISLLLEKDKEDLTKDIDVIKNNIKKQKII